MHLISPYFLHVVEIIHYITNYIISYIRRETVLSDSFPLAKLSYTGCPTLYPGAFMYMGRVHWNSVLLEAMLSYYVLCVILNSNFVNVSL